MSIGRGLGALITTTNSAKKPAIQSRGLESSDRVWHVPVSEIKPDSDQPRRHFKPEELQELSDSIKEHGILQPLLVSELPDGGYQLIAGERRWRAAQMAHIATVPVIVKKLADEQRLEVALTEFIKTNKGTKFSIEGGALGEKNLSADEAKALAKLPSRDELRGMLVGTLQAPITGFVRALSGNLSGLVRVLKAVEEKKAA
jgi:ParB/RepB/Spo0J family partition protein